MHQRFAPGVVTLLLIPSLILLLSLGLSIGLTYLPCYASLCTEEFYPFETRLHLAIFYAILGSTGCVLAAFAYLEPVRRILSFYVVRRRLPILDARITVGGLLGFIWIGGVILAMIGIWLPAAEAFYQPRLRAVGWLSIEPFLAVTNLIGHHCDILAGLLLLPITRNSLLGRAFRLHTPVLLFAHKFIAYWLLISVIAHAIPYFAALPQIADQNDPIKRAAINQDNPNLTMGEADARSLWDQGVLAEGVLALVIMLLMVATSLPYFRRVAYNTFYYTHIISATLFLALVSFHASSNFYCLLPGLLLWVFDGAVRIRALSRPTTEAALEATGNGWYKVHLPSGKNEAMDSEKMITHPLQTYYVNVPAISRLQIHAFTAHKVSTPGSGAELMFRRAEVKGPAKCAKEWTWKLADFAGDASSRVPVKLRFEGPYVQRVPKVFEAKHVLCIVGGTGITGAYSMAQDWLAHRALEPDSHFTLVWTVRTAAAADISDIHELQEKMSQTSNMRFIVHVSGRSGRIDPATYVQSIFDTTGRKDSLQQVKMEATPDADPMRGFVYCSGPQGLLQSTESACVAFKSQIRHHGSAQRKVMDWYIACWEV